MSDSPAVIIFDTNGNEVTVADATTIPTNTRAIISAGSDGTTSHYIKVDSSGNQTVVGTGIAGTPSGGVITIQGSVGGTAIPVTGSITTTAVSSGIVGSAVPTSATMIGGTDGINLQSLKVFDLDTDTTTDYNLGVSIRLPALGGSVVGGTSSNPIRIDPTGQTVQPISATSLPLPTGAALDSTLTNGSQKAIIRGGAKGTTTAADVTSAVVDANTQALHVAVTGTPAVTISSGTITANFGTIAGVSTETTLGTRLADATFTGRINTFGQKTMTNSTPIVIASDQSVIPISGTVTANNASISTTGSAVPTSASLSGGSVTTSSPTYTNGQMSALSLTTSGALRTDGSSTTQPVSGSVSITGTPAVTVTSGTITANAGTGTFAVSGTVTSNIGTTNGLALDATLTGGTLKSILRGGTKGTTTAADLTSAAVDANTQALHVQLTGTSAVSGTVTANIGTIAGIATEATLGTLLADSTFTGRINTLGQKVMASSMPVVISSDQSAIPITGSITATNPSVGTVAATAPTSSTYIGAAVTTTAPTYTTGQMNALSLTTSGALRTDASSTTQPISVSSLPLPSGASTETTLSTRLADSTFTGRINTLGQKTMSASTPVVISSDQSAIPITGSITATNPSVSATGASPPASATYAGGSVTTAAPTYTTGQISALSLTTSGSLRVDGSSTTQPISGTVSVTGTVASTQSGTWTVQPGNTANTTPWLATLSQGGNAATVTASNALKIDGSAVTQPISGTITANVGTTNGLSLDATLTGGNQKTILRGGAKGTTTAADLTSSAVDANTQALHVAVTGTTSVSGTVTSNQGTANTASNAWFIKNTDGTNIATVKGASTAAVATDSALVVAISPNNAVTTQPGSNATATLSNVGSSTSSVTILASNTARKGAAIYNDSIYDLYLKFGSTASITSFTVKVPTAGYYEVPFWYNGILTGIWVTIDGNARVTEIS